MQDFLEEQKESTLLSGETPLISNLNMCENIALIKEVHENMSLLDAEHLANKLLSDMGLEQISSRRIEKCSKEEIFLVMFIRAIMTQEYRVIIKRPGTLLESLSSIKDMIERMQKIDHDKEIYLLDYVSNKHYYKESACSMAK